MHSYRVHVNSSLFDSVETMTRRIRSGIGCHPADDNSRCSMAYMSDGYYLLLAQSNDLASLCEVGILTWYEPWHGAGKHLPSVRRRIVTSGVAEADAPRLLGLKIVLLQHPAIPTSAHDLIPSIQSVVVAALHRDDSSTCCACAAVWGRSIEEVVSWITAIDTDVVHMEFPVDIENLPAPCIRTAVDAITDQVANLLAIDVHEVGRPWNLVSRWIVDVGFDGSEMPAMVMSPLDGLLTGAGQSAVIADSGLDYNSCFFYDNSTLPLISPLPIVFNSTHRKVFGCSSICLQVFPWSMI